MNTQTSLPTLRACLTTDYGEPSYPRRLIQMMTGIRQPRQSREYKEAMIELQRLSAPLAAVLLPLFAVSLLLLLENNSQSQDSVYGTQLIAFDPAMALVEIHDLRNNDSPPEETSVEFKVDSPNVQFTIEAPLPNSQVYQTPSAVLASLPRASCTGLWKGLTGVSREPKARAGLMNLYDGDQLAEDAVMRSLRWLKKFQQDDGSWKSQRIAMTGLATLAFLAHGEKPGSSAEFGETIRKALDFLLSKQREDGRFNGVDGNEYAHPIATYALCEAYGMTLNPNVKAAAEKALTPIIKGQHPTGGWTYKMDPNVSPEDGKYRDDTSYMGWCAQALKAAKLAQLHVDGLEKATKLTIKGFQKNANPKGGFGYTAPGQGGLTSVGTLCLQLLGASSDPNVKKSLELMDAWAPSFDMKSPLSGSLQYSCYYATQAKFHAGGKRWENWNKVMKPLYVKAQQIEKGAIKDDQGRAVDIGWWTNGDAHTDRPVMDTCLAALQLMVYYRNLPTTSKAAVESDVAVAATSTDIEDITVYSGNL